jgi:hypothetical protein
VRHEDEDKFVLLTLSKAITNLKIFEYDRIEAWIGSHHFIIIQVVG